MSSTYEKLSRLKNRLQQSPATVQELSEISGCSIRSVYRHLEVLDSENCGLRRVQNADGRRYFLEQNVSSVPAALVQGLQKMQKELSAGGNIKHAKIIPAVLAYLQPQEKGAPLPEAINLDPFFELDHGPLSEFAPSEQKVEKLLAAIHAGKELQLTYIHRDGSVEKIVFQPWHVVLRVGRLYLLGSRAERNAVESLVVKRIQMIVGTPRYFVRPEFDVGEHYRYCFGQWVPRQKGSKPLAIVLDLRDPWGRMLFAESNFNPPAKIRETRDGVRAELKLYDTPDLRRWLLSLMPEIQVLEPAALRADLRAQLHEMAKTW